MHVKAALYRAFSNIPRAMDHLIPPQSATRDTFSAGARRTYAGFDLADD